MSKLVNHTPTPWRFVQRADETGKLLAVTLESSAKDIQHNDPVIFALREDWINYVTRNDTQGRANLERIVACVNALDGVENPGAVTELINLLIGEVDGVTSGRFASIDVEAVAKALTALNSRG